jgi:hypothetical protein
MTFGCEPQRQATRAAEPSSPRLPSRPTVDAPRPSSASDESGSHPNQLCLPLPEWDGSIPVPYDVIPY